MVLAIIAVKVAAEGAEGVHQRARAIVEEGLLLDGIKAADADLAVT
jgi:hypothetical protein